MVEDKCRKSIIGEDEVVVQEDPRKGVQQRWLDSAHAKEQLLLLNTYDK